MLNFKQFLKENSRGHFARITKEFYHFTDADSARDILKTGKLGLSTLSGDVTSSFTINKNLEWNGESIEDFGRVLFVWDAKKLRHDFDISYFFETDDAEPGEDEIRISKPIPISYCLRIETFPDTKFLKSLKALAKKRDIPTHSYSKLSKVPYSLSESQQKPEYPRAGKTVDGREVLSNIPNQISISATFTDYEILPGIREVPMSDFGGPKTFFYAADDFKRSKALAEQIKHSGQISPLIVAIDEDGPYILEGAHRFVALHYLGAKSFPALVVIDQDD